jgi:hypothetical protein
MIRYGLIAAVLGLVLPSAPSFAVTAKQKMATCKFGADDQQLQGKPRALFIKNCMANRNDPRGNAGPGVPAMTAGPTAAPPPKN